MKNTEIGNSQQYMFDSTRKLNTVCHSYHVSEHSTVSDVPSDPS